MKLVRWLLTLSVALVLVITTASAILRLSQYGLGCADWPACYGVNPVGESILQAASPLYWVRALHRICATLAGLLFVAAALIGWNGWTCTRDRVLSLAPLVLAAFLAWLGRYTPSDLPAVTLGNLLGGMATLAVLWWLRASLEREQGRGRVLSIAAAIGLGLLFVQMALGALTSARLAAVACTAFPHCGQGLETWVGAVYNPFVPFASDPLHESALRGLHMIHRLAGMTLAVFLAWLGWRAVRSGPDARAAGIGLIGLAAAQVGLGAAMVMARVPLALAVAHNVLAALLVLALVSLLAGRNVPGPPVTDEQ
jgi:heme a synthase